MEEVLGILGGNSLMDQDTQINNTLKQMTGCFFQKILQK
jgi:hypothetical protein